MIDSTARQEAWPILRYDDWKDSLATLHLWLEIVGKIRLVQSPMINHWWQSTLYVSPRGLTTSTIPYVERAFQIDFDFIDHALLVHDSNGGKARVGLAPMSVAQFYRRVMDALRSLGLDVTIRTMPSEIPDAVPFERDEAHAAYDATQVNRFWRILLQADRLFQIHRSRFVGKSSPVHVFWGAPDLAVTRFSGRGAPPHPGGIPNLPDWITREAYSSELSSAGWWPGAAGLEALFYAYAYPEPEGFAKAHIEPSAAFYHEQLHEFVLPYESVRQSDDPDGMVLAFLQSTYEATARLGHWDPALERARTISLD